MDHGDPGQARLIGDYILGPKIGSGSFAVVWRSRHRHSGIEVAVKEIDKKLLSPKVSENLLKEISILSTINHPNIIRLFEAIETSDKIYLVLEYCDGGDLAGYIHRHGKVSEATARHFMRQLAAGLQVLQEKHLIHRDLKPQNLLLSANEAAPLLKIGDFGFARSLTPQDLADTLCGSPLYMAPEIIQNKKYDAKADLWSVGAILFQLVTGKPPFDGNSQLQLFQNILTCTELQFPHGSLQELHPDCVNLCRSLLRHNPVERLTFKEFFKHRFLEDRRTTVDIEQSSTPPGMKFKNEQSDSFASDKRPQLHPKHALNSSNRNLKLTDLSVHDNMASREKYHGNTSSSTSGHVVMPNIVCGRMEKCVDSEQCSSAQLQVSDSLESIEKDYFLVSPQFASMERFSYYLTTSASLQESSTNRESAFPPKKSEQKIATSGPPGEIAASTFHHSGSTKIHGSHPAETSCSSALLREEQGLSILDPSNRLQLLHHYVQVLAELAQEKYNAELFAESFSIELVILATWKKALQICHSWLVSSKENELPGSTSATPLQHGEGFCLNSEDVIEFNRPSSVCIWAEQGFIAAFDRAEKLSDHLQEMDAAAEMPDAMEIIFQKALLFGTGGAVDEYMDNKGSAAASYSRATLLLSFIVEEATSLPLNPPFSLTPADKKRIQSYINNLESHQSRFLTSQPFHKQSPGSLTK